ncbi:MAG TPA: DUF2007 domain-containing protein [Chthonomonadaceae bacterium]|nr:DUF2007 domain-containing protein [Chthonomonadaceae bacterium]
MSTERDGERVAIFYANNLAEADIVRARLEAAGIAAIVEPSRIPAAEKNDASSVRVLVPIRQAEAAQALLQENTLEEPVNAPLSQ